MSHEPCPECGDTESSRYKEQVAEFFEDPDGGTDIIGWGETLKEKCGNCDAVITETTQ